VTGDTVIGKGRILRPADVLALCAFMLGVALGMLWTYLLLRTVRWLERPDDLRRTSLRIDAPRRLSTPDRSRKGPARAKPPVSAPEQLPASARQSKPSGGAPEAVKIPVGLPPPASMDMPTGSKLPDGRHASQNAVDSRPPRRSQRASSPPVGRSPVVGGERSTHLARRARELAEIEDFLGEEGKKYLRDAGIEVSPQNAGSEDMRKAVREFTKLCPALSQAFRGTRSFMSSKGLYEIARGLPKSSRDEGASLKEEAKLASMLQSRNSELAKAKRQLALHEARYRSAGRKLKGELDDSRKRVKQLEAEEKRLRIQLGKLRLANRRTTAVKALAFMWYLDMVRVTRSRRRRPDSGAKPETAKRPGFGDYIRQGK